MIWDNHGWIRFRSTMALLLARSRNEEPKSYPLDQEQREYAEQITTALEDLGAELAARELRRALRARSPHCAFDRDFDKVRSHS
jgi:methionyl-tRNA formyltransferase